MKELKGHAIERPNCRKCEADRENVIIASTRDSKYFYWLCHICRKYFPFTDKEKEAYDRGEFHVQRKKGYISKTERRLSKDHKDTLSKSHRGKKLKDCTKQAISKTLKNKPKPLRTKEHSKKLGESHSITCIHGIKPKKLCKECKRIAGLRVYYKKQGIRLEVKKWIERLKAVVAEYEGWYIWPPIIKNGKVIGMIKTKAS